MKVKTGIAALALAVAASAPALSATLNVGEGETRCDSYNNLRGVSKALCANTNNVDLGQTPGSDAVNFAGSGTLLGWVKDDSGTSANYADAANVTLASSSILTFSIFDIDTGFDGTLEFGGAFGPVIMNAGNTIVQFAAAAGTYGFKFNAALPNQSSSNTTEYTLEVAAVPLPAAGLLLVGALGGLGMMRRHKKS